ncbi:hypothetical protein F5X96DRAFT_625782 [Biscogniauxia mediterranea]|nr:hypothetical protein F5X96DRAFT_625782 [Biscogniauxia mediterranea]
MTISLANTEPPPEDKRLSPLLFEFHAGIAQKAYFAICVWDPRRDEAILLGNYWKRQDWKLGKLIIYPGLPRGFWTTCPDLPITKQWLEDLIGGVRWLVG